MLPEVRMARIVDTIGAHRSRKLSCVDAAELLGISERHFRRLRDAYEAKGAEGVVDRRRERASGRRAPVDEIEWVLEEFRTRYFDFTALHSHEAIAGRVMADGTPFGRGYTWTKSVLQSRRLTTKAPKRSAHRKKRERRPMVGMMLFQDGSRHAWLRHSGKPSRRLSQPCRSRQCTGTAAGARGPICRAAGPIGYGLVDDRAYLQQALAVAATPSNSAQQARIKTAFLVPHVRIDAVQGGHRLISAMISAAVADETRR